MKMYLCNTIYTNRQIYCSSVIRKLFSNWLWRQLIMPVLKIVGLATLLVSHIVIMSTVLKIGILDRKLTAWKQHTSVFTNSTAREAVMTTRSITFETITEQKQVNQMELVSQFIPSVKVPDFSCSDILNVEKEDIFKAQSLRLNSSTNPSYIDAIQDCSHFIKERRYTMQPLSEEEAAFPIAYSIIVYRNSEQVERLLRAIYRPQNYYCIHIDVKAVDNFRKTITWIAECFHNVFLASTMVDVEWGMFSVIEPELICMHDLWKYKAWRYFINLTGQEFPLQTNGDLVKILKVLDGANIVEGTFNEKFPSRIRKARTDPPPQSLRLTKGSLHIAAQRGFVDYILHNETALKFRDWVKDTLIPDETFFSSLSHNPKLKVPGSYLGEINNNAIYPYLGRFVNWGEYTCHGTTVRGVCVFGVRDLPLFLEMKQLFLNKFDIDMEPLAFECMEEIHYNKTRDSVLGLRTFNISYYAGLDLIRNHIL